MAKINPADKFREWRARPSVMVRELFGVEPDIWQIEALDAFPSQQRMAFLASKGVGKTTTLAWLGWNFLLTRPYPKCAATSISGANLNDNFWTEMAKWQDRAPLLKAMFEWTKTRIFAKESPETWWMSARTWPQSGDAQAQADTLAGLHADYILFVLDESGGMPDAIMASAEAALSSCVEGHIVQAGNPTQLSGPLYRAATVERRLWFVISINGDPDSPKRSSRVSKQWAQEQIEKYGRDNSWVKVNVFGEFPSSSLNVLIGPDEVSAAMKRYYREFEIGRVPKIMGIDVARFGDDGSSIARRMGIQMFPFKKYRNLDSMQGAGHVNREWADWEADAAFIDATGGFGSGWEDQLKALGRAPIGVHFSAEAHDKVKYYNKRAEMSFDFVDWIKRGGALPNNPELLAALTNTTYSFKDDRLLLEPKELVKAKLGYSPDDYDSAILTFAEPVTIVSSNRRKPNYNVAEYNPFADVDTVASRGYKNAGSYDPFVG